MNRMVKVVENNLSQIKKLCKRHKLRLLYLFGSALDPNYFNDNSDVDFLYEYDFENYPNWDTGDFDIVTNFFELKNTLEILLQREVDLVPNNLRNPYLKKSVEDSKQLIYGKS
jgi:predicted nucleotidyltransferase